MLPNNRFWIRKERGVFILTYADPFSRTFTRPGRSSALNSIEYFHGFKQDLLRFYIFHTTVINAIRLVAGYSTAAFTADDLSPSRRPGPGEQRVGGPEKSYYAPLPSRAIGDMQRPGIRGNKQIQLEADSGELPYTGTAAGYDRRKTGAHTGSDLPRQGNIPFSAGDHYAASGLPGQHPRQQLPVFNRPAFRHPIASGIDTHHKFTGFHAVLFKKQTCRTFFFRQNK
jgi:hypothetical protein